MVSTTLQTIYDTIVGPTPFGTSALDPILDQMAGQGLAVFDLGEDASDLCWPGGNPVNGSSIADLAEKHALTMSVASGDSVHYVGGGFDFSACAKNGNCLKVNPAAMAAIAAVPANRKWLIFDYVRLPDLANWPASGYKTLYETGPYFSTSTLAQCYLSTVSGNKQIAWFRQTSAGTGKFYGINIEDADAGKVALVAQWWDRTEGANGTSHGYLRTLGGGATKTVSEATGAETSVDFSAATLAFGISPTANFWAATLAGEDLKARHYKQCAGGLINLTGLQVDVLSLLAEDWDRRIVERAAFSTAMAA